MRTGRKSAIRDSLRAHIILIYWPKTIRVGIPQNLFRFGQPSQFLFPDTVSGTCEIIEFLRSKSFLRAILFRIVLSKRVYNAVRSSGPDFPLDLSGPLQKLGHRKNLWGRKCVRRAIFRNVEVRVEGGKVPFNPYVVCNTSNCVTVRPVRGHLTPKMNITFFIRNLIRNIFLFNNFFEKSCIFRENRKKLF